MQFDFKPVVLTASKTFIVACTLLLGACATTGTQDQNTGPDLSQVKENQTPYFGQRIRWGGSIASVRNEETISVVEIVERPLYRSGRPKAGDSTAGRFMVEVDEFLDPEIYKQGRLLTIEGELSGSEEGKIGDRPYDFPVITASQIKLWPRISRTSNHYPYGSPFYSHHDWRYGPGFYNPWHYPYGPRHHHHDHKPDKPRTLKSPIYRNTLKKNQRIKQ